MAYKAKPRMQLLAMRNTSGELLGAASARCAAELGRRYKGEIPPEAVADVAQRFEQWLRSACDAAQAVPTSPEDDAAELE